MSDNIIPLHIVPKEKPPTIHEGICMDRETYKTILAALKHCDKLQKIFEHIMKTSEGEDYIGEVMATLGMFE